MAYPTAPEISYSYTGFAAGLGDGSFPGSQMDDDLATLQDAVGSIVTFMQAFVRSDGVLKLAAMPSGSDLPGALVSHVFASELAVDTTTTVMPADDTIPQNDEGAEFLTVSITPESATSVLRVTAELCLSPSTSTNLVTALFRDSGADAIAADIARANTGNPRRVFVTTEVVAGSTDETTFKVRAGMADAGTLTLNGIDGSRVLGGVLISSLTVTEFKAP